MKPLSIQLEPGDLELFPPQVQEALLRLARRGQPPVDPRTASERLAASIKHGPTEADLQRKVNEFQLPDGISIRETPSLKPRR